jgi:hypothetical protein
LACTRLARREKASSRAVADDTLGASGAAVKPWKSIVTGNRPYLPCKSPVILERVKKYFWEVVLIKLDGFMYLLAWSCKKIQPL